MLIFFDFNDKKESYGKQDSIVSSSMEGTEGFPWSLNVISIRLTDTNFTIAEFVVLVSMFSVGP